MPARLALLALTLLLAACGGPVKRVWPPQASLQELAVQADGQWRLTLRVQNISTVPMRFDRIDLRLRVAGVEAGQLAPAGVLAVGANSAEVVDVLISPPPAARAPMDAVLLSRHTLRYRLDGRIESGEPRGRYDIEFESALSPVPGLDGVLR